MKPAQRITDLPPYLFAEIDRKIAEARKRGVDVISLGIGDPDRPTPESVVEEACRQVHNPANHRYPSYEGLPEFRGAVADWYRRRFGVELDPRTEVVTLIGSKEGIAHISLCYVDPGDINLVPDPGYPVYEIGTAFAGGTSYHLPLLAERGFLPDLSSVPSEVARRAKLMFLNYPNNPTGAVAPPEFFADAVAFAREYDLLICHDAAYSEIGFDGYLAPSFLQTPGAKEVGVEFHSLSKTYNMTGWRLGWMAGNADAVEALGRVKTNIDSGVFQAIQYAGVVALEEEKEHTPAMRRLYQERRDEVVAGLRRLGWPIEPPRASIYVWAPCPAGLTSTAFATLLLEKAGVVVTPGVGYGQYGEGYFRISLCVEVDRIREAFSRMERAGIRFDRAAR
ncbi:MAG TPA: LL-diaminopimelate aminotransferase [Firmicutes bacterium]|nr:LL-diaminopimelate aminotransferase [Bacillota bacterium]